MTLDRRSILVGSGAVALAGAGAASLSFLRMGSGDAYASAMDALRRAPGDAAEQLDLVRYATLAANGHNTQPWRFSLSEGMVEIRPDLARRTPVVDPDDHHLYVSLGCAAENLSLAASARGRIGEVGFDDADDGTVAFAFASGAPAPSALFDAIPKRQSTRADYDGRSVSAADLRTLADAARVPGVDVVLVTDRAQLTQLRDLVIAGNTAQMADTAFVRELKTWIRFNPREALQHGDGLYSGASGNPNLPSWLGPLMFDIAFTTASENDRYARQVGSSAGLAVFVAAKEDRAHWVRVGQACQRFALQATALGLKHAFLNQPVEVAALRSELSSLMGFAGRRPDLVMRFGYGPTLPMSPRRPVADVII